MPDHRDPDHSGIAPPQIDRTVLQHGNQRGSEGHYSGQEADSSDHALPDQVDGGARAGGAPSMAGADADPDAADLPPDAGHRAHVDQRTGEVGGSGAGAGGGRTGEDPDSDQGGSNTE